MKLNFDTTTWQKKHKNRTLFITYSVMRMGNSILLSMYNKDNPTLRLRIKTKEDLKHYLHLLHIAGVMYGARNGEIQECDRLEFTSIIIKISDMKNTALKKDSKLIDTYAHEVFIYGRYLWELLWKSNLMFLLS